MSVLFLHLVPLTNHPSLAIVRLFQMRRTPDSAQKQAILEGGNMIASIIILHLEDRESSM